MRKTVGVKYASDSSLVSGRPPFLVRISTSAWQPGLLQRKNSLAGCLATYWHNKRDNDFPVRTPSEHLLFKYFPYSSFAGKQYRIEISWGRRYFCNFKSAAFSLPWLGEEACLEPFTSRPGNRMWQNESRGTDVGTKHLAALGPVRPVIRDWFPQSMSHLDHLLAPEGHSHGMKIRVFFLFSTHPPCLLRYFFSVPWEICVFAGSVLCPAFVSIPRQRSI